MHQILDNSETFRIHVTAATPAAPLAILSIASILGIEPQQAADRLATLPTVLAENVAPPVARRLSALLTALGIQVRLDPTLSALPIAVQEQLDVSVQPKGHLSPEAIARLSRRLGMSEVDVSHALRRPDGLVLRDRSQDEICALRRALRRERALRLVVSAPPTAVYDAFLCPGSVRPTAALMRLGVKGCRITGAVFADMNRATAVHLARQAGGSLMILDRAFERFDLYLRAAPHVDADDLERFLAGRPTAPGTREATVGRLVDADLPHAAALQFVADYAAIGLEVRLALRGLAARENR